MTNQQRRNIRTKAKIKRFSNRVRLVVSRSNKHISAQLVDQSGKTLTSVIDKTIKTDKKITKTEKATLVGKEIAQKAKDKKIHDLVFDRGAYKYHGRVKAVCEAVRSEKINI